MKTENIVLFLNKIESDFNVDRWIIDGVYVWPLIRIDLGTKLTFHDILNYQKEQSSFNKKMLFVLNNLKSTIRYFSSRINDRSKEDTFSQKVDVVFLTDGVSYVKIKGVWFEKYCDSLRIILKDFGISVINLVSLNKYYVPRFAPSIFIQPNINFAIIKSIFRSKFDPVNKNDDLTGYDDFLKFVSKETENKINLLSIKDLYFKTKKIQAISAYYKKRLIELRPKLGVSECYYGDYCLAFNLACSELRITSVDMQHGVQGDYHIAYGTWSKIPANGYQLLPNIFWCWSESEEKIINNWANSTSNKHRAMTLGNTFNIIWKNDILFKNENTTLIPRHSENSPNILITLQYGIATEENLKEVLKAISLTQKDYNWWVRLHPSMLNEEVGIREMLDRYGVEIYEMDLSSSLPLFSVLSQTNIHLTYYSSSVIEATDFAVPSIITSELGVKIFNEQIKSGWALPALNSSEIIAALNSIINNRVKIGIEKNSIEDRRFDRKQQMNELIEIIKG